MCADNAREPHDHSDDVVVCTECRKEVPADLAIQPEGEDYALFFCTPECHAQWRASKGDPLEREHRRHSGTDQGR